MHARGITLALAVAALLAGCGTNETSPSAQVKAVVHGFLSREVDGRASEACDFLTGPAKVEEVAFVAKDSRLRTAKTCADALGVAHDLASSKLLDALSTADITDVHVSGSHATVVVESGDTFKPQTVSLKRAFGHMARPWEIDGPPNLGG